MSVNVRCSSCADFSWAKLAEDPNVIQWDEEAQANLQKLIADYERVKAENESPLEIRSGLSLGERPPGGSHADPYVWLTVEGSDIPAVRDTFDKLKASLIQATIPLVAGQERSLSEPALERWKQQAGIVQ